MLTLQTPSGCCSVAQSCLTLCDPTDCSTPGFPVLHYHLQFAHSNVIESVQFSSVSQSCPTLCNPMDYSMPGLPVHHQLLEFTPLMSIESVMPSNHLILCCPLLLPSIFPSIRVFSNESLFPIGGQSIGVSASASVLPKNIQDWFPLGWTG